ncbi:protease [Candidatus Pacearchaeota archaeon ex4484_71]|nr:MAG: protease [Candidatus Pacearchaeota archaeon ex4484_71]
MERKKNECELLAPVGDFKMLVAAVEAGADAVYFGLKEFSMRTNARNFTIGELDKINKICKPKGVKKYLTLNVIVYDREIEKLEKVIKKVKGKIDAVICWDLAVINLCKKYKIPFHISTQASVSNRESLKFYKRLGAERVVLARELDLKQIKALSKYIEIEAFVHGAMCVAVSGRCFMSQHLFGRSANRGECTQVCRRAYTKIEGRNRDPRYVDTVVRVYRKALDLKRPLSERDIEESLKELEKVYNRGFSSGFYFGTPTSDDFAKAEHSAATERKHFVGKILHYYPKIGVGTIKLVSSVKLGDKINIMGNTTGIRKFVVESMEINGKKVGDAKKGEEVAIKFNERVRKNDEVYVIYKK